MTSGAFVLISGLLCLFAMVIVAIHLDYKDMVKKEKELNIWLAEQNTKPKARIFFITVKGESHYSRYFEPSIGFFDKKLPSRYNAFEGLRRCYEEGFFTSDADVTYPACNIMLAEIHQENI